MCPGTVPVILKLQTFLIESSLAVFDLVILSFKLACLFTISVLLCRRLHRPEISYLMKNGKGNAPTDSRPRTNDQTSDMVRYDNYRYLIPTVRAGHALFFTLRACAFALFGGALRAGAFALFFGP